MRKISFKKIGNRASDKITNFIGSWWFIFSFFSGMIIWILVNQEHIINIDPKPYILLNLILSMLAAVQGSIIMISQSRREKRDRAKLTKDLEVDERTESKVDELQKQLDRIEKYISSKYQ